MINRLTSMGPSVLASSYSIPYISNSGQGAGDVRFNTASQQMEVFNGSSWVNVCTSANVSLTPEAEETIKWAYNKMIEEAMLKTLAEENAAVRIALENVKQAQEQLKITAILAKETQ